PHPGGHPAGAAGGGDPQRVVHRGDGLRLAGRGAPGGAGPGGPGLPHRAGRRPDGGVRLSDREPAGRRRLRLPRPENQLWAPVGAAGLEGPGGPGGATMVIADSAGRGGVAEAAVVLAPAPPADDRRTTGAARRAHWLRSNRGLVFFGAILVLLVL